jgi:outer membrane protein assembly factor BamD
MKIEAFCKLSQALLLVAFCSSGCHKETEAELGPEEEFKIASEQYEKQDYGGAVQGFKRVVFRFPGSKWAEESQYKLAKCHFLEKDFSTAQIEYDFFIRSYPRSRFTDNAAFESAVSGFEESPAYYLDPLLAKKTLQEFRAFIKKYPDSELSVKAEEYVQKCVDSLVRKEIENAKLYIRIGKLESAVLYLESVQKEHPQTSFSAEITDLLDQCEELANQ